MKNRVELLAVLTIALGGCQGGDESTAFVPENIVCDEGQLVEGLCIACPVETVFDAESATCTPCPAGTFAANNACATCPEGTISAEGAITCEACTPGTISTEGATACEVCTPGTFALDNACEACTPGTVSTEGAIACTPCPADTTEIQNTCRACPDDFTAPPGTTQCLVAAVDGRVGVRDYGYAFWPSNHWVSWGTYLDTQHLQTGYYALALDVSTASLDHFGLIETETSASEALRDPNTIITDLPTAAVRYRVESNGRQHLATGFYGRERAPTNPSELIDMGRFMQRIEIPEVTYAGSPDLLGSVEIASMPRHLVLTHRTSSTAGGALTLGIEFSGEALARFPQTRTLLAERALAVNDDAGKGWSFIIPERPGAASLITRSEDGSLLFQSTFETDPGQEVALSVIAVPYHAGNEDQLSVWLRPSETVEVSFRQLRREGVPNHDPVPARWDPERGLYVIDLRNLRDVGGGGADWADLDKHNWYNRHEIVVNNLNESPVSVPLAFDGGNNAAYYIVGGSPLLRDTSGEPIGVPMQISKNWHDGPAWYHLYTAMEFDPGEHEFEHTFAHAKWGETYAAAHAQLSLVGWGQNQQWDESSLGAFGESITYDPDLTLSRSMVDDVRPFLVNAEREWGWTGNVGGATFLVYASSLGYASPPDHQLGRMRTHYAYTGPNLTKVIYSGVTRDNKIDAEISTQLGRTDDLVRAYYHMTYTFLEDVAYDRLALFQMVADRYSDNGFRRYAYGNVSEVSFDAEIPDHRTTGYPSASERGIPLLGDSPWVMLYDNQRTDDNLPERFANVGFVVRDYRARIGDEVVTTPHINLTRTFNGGWSQMAFELGVPFDPNASFIPAGSVITATVEYLIPPSDKAVYYGQSDHLTAMPAEHFQSTEMMRHLAEGNHLEVVASLGTVLRTHPVELRAEGGRTAVEFTLEGGLGYTPVTIHGLARPEGWRLEVEADGQWTRVNQEVEGNDYWQAYDDASTGTFDLVFNLHNRGLNRYRLVR